MSDTANIETVLAVISYILLVLLHVLALVVAGLHLWRWYCRGRIFVKSNRRLDGKTALVTGGNTGMGYETTKELARRGARVVMLCLELEEGEKVAKQINDEFRGVETFGHVTSKQLNLASLLNIEKCAEAIKAEERRIDLLVLNAGCCLLTAETAKTKRTEDGFELQMGINFMGHFALVNHLLPLIRKTASKISRDGDVRVVAVASAAHTMTGGPLNLHDLNWEREGTKSMTAYAHSKLAVVLFMRELAQRLKPHGIVTASVNPGAVVSPLTHKSVDELVWWTPKVINDFSHSILVWLLRSARDGAQTTIHCCLAESARCHSGAYFEDCAEAKASKHANSNADARRLYEVAADLTHTAHLQEV